MDSIRLEVKQLQLDLEVKDKRLEKKNKKISELLQEGCEQGKKCEIAFHGKTFFLSVGVCMFLPSLFQPIELI